MICFPGEHFYAKKGLKTTQFLGTVTPRFHPWDRSFRGYQISEIGGIRYTTGRGVVGYPCSPFGHLYWHAHEQTRHESSTADLDDVVIVTNRLSWGDMREPDHVIGSGVVRTFNCGNSRTARINGKSMPGRAKRTFYVEIVPCHQGVLPRSEVQSRAPDEGADRSYTHVRLRVQRVPRVQLRNGTNPILISITC